MKLKKSIEKAKQQRQEAIRKSTEQASSAEKTEHNPLNELNVQNDPNGYKKVCRQEANP